MKCTSPQWHTLTSARWTYDTESRLIQDTDGNVVVRYKQPPSAGDHSEWNAWLLAAAPELLRSLDSVLNLLKEHAPEVHGQDHDVLFAQYVIQKALGRHV